MTDFKIWIKVLFILFFFFLSSNADELVIKSNYPIPKNNINEIYKKTKNISYIIKLLRKTEEFEKISYRNGVLYLWKKPVLRKVSIKGNKSFWKREILAVTGLIEGHPIDRETVHQIVSRLRQFYFDKGYPFASFKVSLKIDDKGDATAFIDIKEGKRAVIKGINVFSDTKIPENLIKEIKKHFGIEKGDDFSFVKVQRNIEKVSSFLKEKGYFDNFVIFYSLYTKKKKYVKINIFVSLGFKYVIKIEGSKFFPEKTLKKLLTFSQGVNYYQITKSLENIINFYKNQGFLDVAVIPDYREDYEKNETYITFNIKEGKRYVINNLNIKTDIKGLSKKLLSFKGNFYQKNKINEFLQKLFKEYYNKGYLSFFYSIKEQINQKEGYVNLFITVKKGKKFIIKDVKVSDKKYRLQLELPSTYKPEEILSLLDDIRKFYNDKGFLDAQVLLDVSFKESKNVMYAYVSFKVNKNERYKTGNTFIYGTKHLSTKAIEKNLSKDRYFSMEEFDKELDFFYSTYVFDTINPYLNIDRKKKQVNKEYVFYEDKRGIFQGSIGYNTNQKFKLALQGTLKNLFNYGFELSGYIEASSLGTTYQVSLGNKFVPFRRSVFLNLFRNYQNHRIFDLLEKGSELLTEKKIDKHRTYSVGISYSDNWLYNQKIFDSRYTIYKVYYWYKDLHGKPKINPEEGYDLKYGVILGFGDYPFQKIMFAYRHFWSWRSFILTPKISLGYIFQNIDNIPLPDRFFLGGISNLRGFRYENVNGNNNKGGKISILFNNEIRYPLYKPFNLYGFVFYDFGNVYEKKSQIKSLLFRDSLGSGVYVPTPVGSFMFYFAYNLHRKEKEDKYRLEFSISTEF